MYIYNTGYTSKSHFIMRISVIERHMSIYEQNIIINSPFNQNSEYFFKNSGKRILSYKMNTCFLLS